MSCLICCLLILFLLIYMATESLGLSLVLSFLIFGVLCLILNSKFKEEQIKKEEKEISFYDSLNLHADKEFRCVTSNNDVFSINLLQSQKKLVFVNMSAKNVIYINYKDILRSDVQQDNATIMESSAKNSLNGAILAGATGAIIGASTKSTQNVCNNLSIRIITSDILNPCITIPLIQEQINRQSITYKKLITFADEVYSTIVAIIHENVQPQVITPANSLPYQTRDSYLAQPAMFRQHAYIRPYQTRDSYLAQPITPSQLSISATNYGQPIGIQEANNEKSSNLLCQELQTYPENQTPSYQWNSQTLQSNYTQPVPTFSNHQPIASAIENDRNMPDLSGQILKDNQLNKSIRNVSCFQWDTDTQNNNSGLNQS